jgi:hypothetical protein
MKKLKKQEMLKKQENVNNVDNRYITLVALTNINKNNIKLHCQLGSTFYDILLENWELGYNFFESFKDRYEEEQSEKTDEKILLNTYIYLAERVEKWKERKVKGQNGIRLTPSTLCNICKHRTSYTTCKAFPSGIPSDLHNKLHTEKHNTQKNDIVFELGKEGSTNANIEPIKNIQVFFARFTSERIKIFGDISRGTREEDYYEE